ncbi:MAG: hypothetical protein LBP72_02900, partial [Dysgonamonadaceae bacterium]|nr:hypothetical protein [Dysgonamonadaceae bacterium]
SIIHVMHNQKRLNSDEIGASDVRNCHFVAKSEDGGSPRASRGSKRVERGSPRASRGSKSEDGGSPRASRGSKSED